MNESATSRTQKRIETDDRILKAATRVFGTRSYSNATLKDIAEEAGVSQGLISQRFESKERLLLSVFDQTQVRSFFSENDSHLPQALYVIIERLKREVVESPDWFAFLKSLHPGIDLPRSIINKTREVFSQTPIISAIEEAQTEGYLPKGDAWDIFQVFFHNATNLIDWYHRSSLPMPENETFLYLIQYNRKELETRRELDRQAKEIETAQRDISLLYAAATRVYPLIIFCNLTDNAYHMIAYENFTTRKAPMEGTYDELIAVGASTIPNRLQQHQFADVFGRENAVMAFRDGKSELLLRHQQMGDDGVVRWFETRLVFEAGVGGEALAIAMTRSVDEEVARFRRYEEALISHEIASQAKTRFLMKLSNDLRSPMHIIMGFTEIARMKADNPEKVRDCMDKMQSSEIELKRLLENALEYANRPESSSISEVRIDLAECSTSLLENSRRLAAQKPVRLSHEVGELPNSCILADEILLRTSMLTVVATIIDLTNPGGEVIIKCAQIEPARDGVAAYRFQVSSSDAGVREEYLADFFKPSVDKSYALSGSMAQVREYVSRQNGSVNIRSTPGEGTTVDCVLRFRVAQ